MKALVYERSPMRYALANAVSRLGAPLGGVGPVQLRDIEPPALPSGDWLRIKPLLSGICGSDLAAISGRTSGYFEQVVSFPFTLGHEIVGRLDDGSRAVVQPALGCVVRGHEPLCTYCESGRPALCINADAGSIARGSQSGFCASTGGGWSEQLVAHQSQIHTIPDVMSDETAVMVEPAACAIHAVNANANTKSAHVAVIGAGTLGLLVTAAAARNQPASLTVGAKYPHQRQFARSFGATNVSPPEMLTRAVRAATGTHMLEKSTLSPQRLTGGADVVFDCIGNAASLEQALAIVRPAGRVVLVGMPASVGVDLAPLWQREVELVGSYCYSGTSHRSDFDQAIALAAELDLGRLVGSTYPLARYRDAVNHAARAGALGTVKVAFDLR